MVKLFAQAGADVVFSYHRRRDAAERLIEETRKHGTRVEAVKADLGEMKGARNLMGHARERLGRLDILVANAGIWNVEDKPIEKLTEEEWDEMMRANLKSIYTAIHFAAPHMIAQHWGRIIAVSSISGQTGEAFHAHYGATKGAIISLVKGLATEMARHKILVNAVAPGWVDTDMVRPVLKSKKAREATVSEVPLGRIASPEEIAGPILFLASDLASYITGEILNVNGGFVLCG